MKRTYLAACALMVAFALLGGCATTSVEAQSDYVSELNKYGTNPLIKAPILRDLESRIRTVVMAPNPHTDQPATTFSPRNKALLDNFSEHYDHSLLMEDITLARAGFDRAVAARYPELGNETACGLANSDAHFPNSGKEPTQFTWQFEQGDCVNGLAHGVARLSAPTANARFVGRFEQGQMIEGIFEMQRSDGARVIQLGGIPTTEHTARLLTSKIENSGYQWHRYGDFDDRGEFEGFGINVVNYVNLMEVRDVGLMHNSRLHGFGALQRRRTWGDGKIPNVWLGEHVNGKLHGLAAWSNTVDTMRIGEWEEGRLNGVVYGSDKLEGLLFHEFFVGRYVDGEKQGWFDYYSINTLDTHRTERKEFEDGYLVAIDDGKEDIEFGQIFAIAAGAAIIGTADIDSASKAEIGGAFMADMIGSGNGSNMQALQQQYDTRTSIAQPIGGGASSTRSTGTSASTTSTNGKSGSAPSPAGTSGAAGTASTSTAQQQQQTSQQQVGATGQPNQTGTSGASTRTAATPPAPASTPRAIQTASAPAATSPAPEPNRYVGAGRDYRYTGSSGTYYRQDLAVDLAKTNLRNQAAAFCNSTYKAEIRWGESHCKASRGAPDEYLCTIDALVNCYVNPCDQAFCGTRD